MAVGIVYSPAPKKVDNETAHGDQEKVLAVSEKKRLTNRSASTKESFIVGRQFGRHAGTHIANFTKLNKLLYSTTLGLLSFGSRSGTTSAGQLANDLLTLSSTDSSAKTPEF